MEALLEVIQASEKSFCKPFSASSPLDGAYPGGLQRLEKGWLNWLSSSEFQIHQI
jgi:hypothetical protein